MRLKRLPNDIRGLWRRLNGLPLQSRLIAAYIIVILLPTVAISYYSYQQINTTYIQDTRLKSMDTLQNEQQTILTQLETMERAAQLAVSDKAVIQYLTENQDKPTAELIEFNENSYARLAQIGINNPSILHLRLYSNSSKTYEIWPIILHESRIKDAPWYSAVHGLGDREAWFMQRADLTRERSDSIRPLEPDPPKLSLLRELELPRGHHAGVIQVDMRLADLAPQTFGKSQEDSARMLLLDAGGGNVSSPIAADRYTRLANRLLSESGLSASSMQYRADGQTYLVTHLPLARLGAQLVQVVSLEKMLQDTGRARNLIIATTVAFIVLVSLITYVANSLILKNLRKLTQAMKQMRRGELPPMVQIEGGEVGELAYHFNRMSGTINELIAQAVRKQALMKEAELRTLYSQIDAHFLYNTLENIKMLAEIEDQRQISDALTSLGGMMRYNFKWEGEYVTLGQELRHIRNYIEVMNIRFDEPVRLNIELPPAYAELELLKMSLQPIVENAFKHGWTEEQGERWLHIRAVDEGERSVRIVIRDNGQGIAPAVVASLNERLQQASAGTAELSPQRTVTRSDSAAHSGYGLLNVQQRIRLFFGNLYGLHIHSSAGEGTEVSLCLPKIMLAGGDIRHETTANC
ncbi:sensor histidine kinase [Paenibacillus campi]|uniref:cache domain-containing sensor histidine kinase n=1 Tax=Paenibacillus campi TaxID=3106031 RepID=UPI002AFF4792|nr:sensor histidine kinase [Paenibacillus sp. SGZ-1009]